MITITPESYKNDPEHRRLGDDICRRLFLDANRVIGATIDDDGTVRVEFMIHDEAGRPVCHGDHFVTAVVTTGGGFVSP